MDELTINTPEHVPIGLEPAGAGSRFLAVLLDAAITTGIASTIGTVALTVLPGGAAYALFITLSFALPVGWHVWFETRGHGRTPGKRALSLRVIDARGLPVSLYQSLARNIVRVIDFAPAFYGVGAAVSLFDPARRRLGDIVANTLVIREAQPLAYSGQLAERRHNSLRTPRVLRLIRHRIPIEEREFLLRLCLRADKLTPTARYDLMEEVARFYRRKLVIEEEHISGENLVRDLTAVLFAKEGR
ncbi:MAG TPA: RDD family protein [Thermoanaerobaculia bacterium]|jgi:uncharacterized RDD family membrane protein YckC|nr:RDD family protein [Thermoanaerobaculia bacterium]